jgi:hypothetical protein
MVHDVRVDVQLDDERAGERREAAERHGPTAYEPPAAPS